MDVDPIGTTIETVSTTRTYVWINGELRERHLHAIYEPPGGYVDADLPDEEVGR